MKNECTPKQIMSIPIPKASADVPTSKPIYIVCTKNSKGGVRLGLVGHLYNDGRVILHQYSKPVQGTLMCPAPLFEVGVVDIDDEQYTLRDGFRIDKLEDFEVASSHYDMLIKGVKDWTIRIMNTLIPQHLHFKDTEQKYFATNDMNMHPAPSLNKHVFGFCHRECCEIDKLDRLIVAVDVEERVPYVFKDEEEYTRFIHSCAFIPDTEKAVWLESIGELRSSPGSTESMHFALLDKKGKESVCVRGKAHPDLREDMFVMRRNSKRTDSTEICLLSTRIIYLRSEFIIGVHGEAEFMKNIITPMLQSMRK
jgi:hypothetical protein